MIKNIMAKKDKIIRILANDPDFGNNDIREEIETVLEYHGYFFRAEKRNGDEWEMIFVKGD